MHFYLPKQAVLCIETIEKAGYEAWAVGGCVRDQLLGIEPKDVDIASNAPPEEILRIFERALPTGLQHGTVTVLLQGVPVEVTRFRLEGGYIDSRRPGWVAPAHCVQEDLARRDFTINAMAWHPERGLLDPFGGQADLVAKTIRTVGTPLERFEEDALRILRAFRFSARFGFELEPNTLLAALENAYTLQNISRERIWHELGLTLTARQPSRLAPLFLCDGLAPFGLSAPVQPLTVLDKAPGAKHVRLALFCRVCRADINEVCQTLRVEGKTARQAKALLEELALPPALNKTEIKKRFALLKGCGAFDPPQLFEEALAAREALTGESWEGEKWLAHAVVKDKEPWALPMLAIGGIEVQELGGAGPSIGRVLQRLLEHVIQTPEDNQPEPLKELAKRILCSPQ